MDCADNARHALTCPHQASSIMVAWLAEDGCSGRFCEECDYRHGVKRWPGLAERIPGPAAGLDALELLRAVTHRRDGG
jgi:hypothetical protein